MTCLRATGTDDPCECPACAAFDAYWHRPTKGVNT